MSTNPLTDVLPAKVRKIAYAVLFLAAIVFAAFQAADGDWVELVGGLITALLGATAASNTNTSEYDPKTAVRFFNHGVNWRDDNPDKP